MFKSQIINFTSSFFYKGFFFQFFVFEIVLQNELIESLVVCVIYKPGYSLIVLLLKWKKQNVFWKKKEKILIFFQCP